MNLTKQPALSSQTQSQQQYQKSALAADNKKFNEIKIVRKTSFLIPPSQESDEDEAVGREEEESSDYISEFPDFKKTINSHKAAYIDLKKRKTSTSQGNKLNGCDSLTNEVFVSSLTKKGLTNQLKKRDNSNEEMYKNSKFRPSTPKVFNYFPVSLTSNSKKTNTSNDLFTAKSMGNVNFNLGNKSADSNVSSINNEHQRLPKINPAIKENLLSSRTHTQISTNKKSEKQPKNLFFPLLISNNNNKNRNENNNVSNLTTYFDDPNGIFFLQSLSHLSMKNLNQT